LLCLWEHIFAFYVYI